METPDARRKRLPREQRERLILDEAVRFFAEMGFEGQTRALAERLGVTQPLLYRYFPDKESLIERVFEEVYLKRWQPAWEHLLRDRSRPLTERLGEFYRQYTEAIVTPEFVRIYMFAGLKGDRVNDRYFQAILGNVLRPLCTELRHDNGLPEPSDAPIADMEINLAWALQGAIIHIAFRKWIFKLPVPEDIGPLIDCTIATFVRGSGDTLRTILEPHLKLVAQGCPQ